MVVREGVVWECARNSGVVHFGQLPAAGTEITTVPVPPPELIETSNIIL